MATKKTSRSGKVSNRAGRAGKPVARKERPAPRNRRRGGPVVRPADVRTILFELARVLAPADLTRLMHRESALRERVASLDDEKLALLREQTLLALDCIGDHLAGRAPQIPYFSVVILAAAVSYFSEALDIIPDFLPRIGRLDDALVMAVACQIAEEGIRRYCEGKGLEAARFIA